jgi:hypothetical protein
MVADIKSESPAGLPRNSQKCSPALRDAACDLIREASAHLRGDNGHLIMCFSTGSRVASVRVEFIPLPEVCDSEDDAPVKADR